MTCSAADSHRREQRARRQALLALFTALAVVVHSFEALLPTPVPWLRLGLANALTVVVLFLYGAGAAWSLTLTRIGLAAILLGRLFSPGFWLALCGGCAATLTMVTMRKVAGKGLSPIGVSVAGAAAHAVGQLLAAWWLLVRHPAIGQTLPVLLLLSIVSGLLTGWLAAVLVEQLQRNPLVVETLPD
ncbi:MAG: hypothetical protein C0614_04010 [Desulfuromonas sp.]|nr:MAG: hypothetical protein C0614_04010 [Desulfuromonas sp.]